MLEEDWVKELENYESTTVRCPCDIEGYENFRKKDKTSRVWWTRPIGMFGEHIFTFDRKKFYNLFRDYPWELTQEEREIFAEDEPYWRDFFKDRN